MFFSHFSGATFIIAENIPNKIYTNIAAINPLSTSVALCKILWLIDTKNVEQKKPICNIAKIIVDAKEAFAAGKVCPL